VGDKRQFGLRGAEITLALAALVSFGCVARPASASPRPVDNSVLTIAPRLEASLGNNFNPFDQTSVLTEMGVPSFIYEPLLQYNELQVNQYYPWLAQSWAFSSSGQTITFYLRAGVTWDDGAHFSASDVAYTFNLLKDNPEINTGDIPIVSAVATNPTTFTLTLSQPSYAYLYDIALVPIVNNGYSLGTDPATYLDSSPDGTGPYALASPSDLSGGRLVLTARRHYWQQGQPSIHELVFPAYPTTTAVASALDNGTLDWAGQPVPDLPTPSGKANANDHDWAPAVNCVSLVVNFTKYPLEELAVRRAVSAAIDRSALSTKAEQGYEPVATSSSGLVPSVDSQYLGPADTADLNTTGDAVLAADIMTDNGFHKGAAGYWLDPAGKEVAFTITDPVGGAYYTAASLTAQQLRSAGFYVTAKGVPLGQWLPDLAQGNFDATIRWSATGPTPYYMYDNWLDPSLLKLGHATATGDYGRIDAATAPALTAAAAAAITKYRDNPSGSPAATSAVEALASVVSEYVPVVPLLYGAAWGEFSTEHATGWPSQANSYEPAQPVAPFDEYTVLQLSPA
jgi:peptide/nickel transport system substrate-binding protein